MTADIATAPAREAVPLPPDHPQARYGRIGVLLMNLAAPTIDYYTRPRTYGHRKAERGFKLGE